MMEWEESYTPLPYVFMALLLLWTVCVIVWTFNTWTKRRWQQCSNLQWILTSVPVLKVLVLGLSFVFWYSCLIASQCSFWVAFGVFVARIFFETACFSAFLLIAHGYCIMHEQLSVRDRRSIAALGSLLYLILTGYKSAVPQFSVLMVLMYGMLFYVIMAHIARNLALLRDQLQHIQDEGVHTMHSAVYTKYRMFKRFQMAMFMVVIAEFLMHAAAEGVGKEYWIRLLMRELTEGVIFFHIGWTFRSRGFTPFFTMVPSFHSSGKYSLPPIYSVEMNEKEFKNLDYEEWHIGVPTSLSKGGSNHKQMMVIVHNPGMSNFVFTDDNKLSCKNPESFVTVPATSQIPLSSSTSSSPSPTTNHNICPDPSSSLVENKGLELSCMRIGSSNFTSRGNLGVGKESGWNSSSKDARKSATTTLAANEKEIIVDMKGLKGYSFLPFENSYNGDPQLLHSRSNTNLQSFGSHHSSIV
jgi:hypothetical protein